MVRMLPLRVICHQRIGPLQSTVLVFRRNLASRRDKDDQRIIGTKSTPGNNEEDLSGGSPILTNENAEKTIPEHVLPKPTDLNLKGDVPTTDSGILLPKDAKTTAENALDGKHGRTDPKESFSNGRSTSERTDGTRKRGGLRMSAWQICEFGGIDKLRLDTDVPVPKLRDPWDVVVKVNAASLNPFDLERLGGFGENAIKRMRQAFRWPPLPRFSFGGKQRDAFPLIMGRDFSGVVVDTGRMVRNLRVGSGVYGVVGPHRQGTFAEYTATNMYCLSPKPETISHTAAASFPYIACTAWSTLKLVENLMKINRSSDTRVLVIGGGGIGSFVVQYLRSLGVQVTTVAGTSRQDAMRELGAEDVIDYETADVESELRQRGRFDVILEASGGDYDYTKRFLKGNLRSVFVSLNYPLLDNLDNLGTIAGLAKTGLDYSTDYLKSIVRGNHIAWAFFAPNGSFLKDLKNLIDSQQIKPVVDKVFEFEQLPDACRYLQNGDARGKVVLKVSKD